jgi:ferrous iron transport protein B
MKPLSIALVGNPNCGKTALFNLLTGSRQKVANYAGVTVERKEGQFSLADRQVNVLDLPGAYSLNATSPDELITRNICMGTHDYGFHPDVLVCVVDATNLRLHLRFVLELKALGKPLLVALNMMDAAKKRGIEIDMAALAQSLGVPVVPTIAVASNGADALKKYLAEQTVPLPAIELQQNNADSHVQVRQILHNAVSMPSATAAFDDRLDKILLHPLFGPVVLALVLFFMFQAVYAWAAPFQDGISASVQWLSGMLGQILPQGMVLSLLQDGIFAGLGTVLEFLPQILILFAFILALEETGYLPRAAFLLDRVMFASGLTGRLFPYCRAMPVQSPALWPRVRFKIRAIDWPPLWWHHLPPVQPDCRCTPC